MHRAKKPPGDLPARYTKNKKTELLCGLEARIKQKEPPMNIDNVYEAYSRLDGFRKNIPEDKNHIKENYVVQYHQIVDLLESVSEKKLQNFKVPPNELERLMATYNTETGQATYTDERYCERAMLLIKVDALLTYFAMMTNTAPKRPIGFNAP